MSEKENKLDWDVLTALLSYCPDTGIFTWKDSRRGAVIKGSIAGGSDSNGYITIKLNGIKYYAHRLAWFYCFKEWPIYLLDHIDEIKYNNRLDNLREATHSQNAHNTGITVNNTTGFKGVAFHKASGKYQAQLVLKGRTKYLGLFTTAKEASEYRNSIAKQEFKEFYNENSTN